MNVASLELCKELYELSGWDDTTYYWHSLISHDMKRWSDYKLQDYKPDSDFGMKVLPAYDLGYLLRKLQNGLELDEVSLDLLYNNYTCRTTWNRHKNYSEEADTPEDAVCKLTIELFKQNILVKA